MFFKVSALKNFASFTGAYRVLEPLITVKALLSKKSFKFTMHNLKSVATCTSFLKIS